MLPGLPPGPNIPSSIATSGSDFGQVGPYVRGLKIVIGLGVLELSILLTVFRAGLPGPSSPSPLTPGY